jgi:hypothetical protein
MTISGFRSSAADRAGHEGHTGLDVRHDPIEQTAHEALRILDDQIAGRVRRPVHMLLIRQGGGHRRTPGHPPL